MKVSQLSIITTSMHIRKSAILLALFSKQIKGYTNYSLPTTTSQSQSRAMSYKRASDGLNMNYDPYHPSMIEKYGKPGSTDSEGFNPYSDSVGAGIYGGRVQRDKEGNVIIGAQYQNHNSRPGPVYAGGGYTPMVESLQSSSEENVATVLEKYPDLVNEVTTGGASPLHMCGMSNRASVLTAFLISKGGLIEAVDTYGYRPLHRMASNNLAIGAEALLLAGADENAKAGGDTPMKIARDAGAKDVIEVLKRFG